MKRSIEGADKPRSGLSERAMSEIGARILSLRVRMDRSEVTFATMLGVAPETVKKWEGGQGIDREALILISSATDTPMEWLIAGLTPVQVESIRKAASSVRRRS